MNSATNLLDVKAVVFDVFGTLAKIEVKRRPYVRLMEMLRAAGRAPKEDDGARLMSTNVGLAGAAELFGVDLPATEIASLELELYAELSTIGFYPEATNTLIKLRNSGFKIGLCSNLAAPYAVPIKLLLPFELDAYAWSFESGAVKPEPAIYKKICDSLGCKPNETLMVGDTLEADYNGPRRFGMQAYLLDRHDKNQVENRVTVLSDLLPLLSAAELD